MKMHSTNRPLVDTGSPQSVTTGQLVIAIEEDKYWL